MEMKRILLASFYFINSVLIAKYCWFPQHPNPVLNHLSSIKFIDAKIGYAVGAGVCIIKSTNGGISWIQKSFGDGNRNIGYMN